MSNSASAVGTWKALKIILNKEKRLALRSKETDELYELIAYDGSIVCFEVTIWKGSVPPTVALTQAENDADKADFEANYGLYANKLITTTVRTIGPSASVITAVTASTTSVALLAANPDRLGATIYNESSEALLLKLGVDASAQSYSRLMLPNDYYEVPFGYTGQIDGIWGLDVGNALVTELTA